jgi:hypothetical protein
LKVNLSRTAKKQQKPGVVDRSAQYLFWIEKIGRTTAKARAEAGKDAEIQKKELEKRFHNRFGGLMTKIKRASEDVARECDAPLWMALVGEITTILAKSKEKLDAKLEANQKKLF